MSKNIEVVLNRTPFSLTVTCCHVVCKQRKDMNKRPPVLGRWTEAAGFVLAVWAISFLILHARNLRLELASLQGLTSRLEREIDFFHSLIRPTRAATKAYMREVHILEDRILSTSDSLDRVRSNGREQIELVKQEHRETEQQLYKDLDRLAEELSVCNDWTSVLKKNQSAVILMGKKHSVITCLMEVGGLKGDVQDAKTKLVRTDSNNKNFEMLTKQWRDKVTSREKEVEECKQQIKDLKVQLVQAGCGVGLLEKVDT